MSENFEDVSVFDPNDGIKTFSVDFEKIKTLEDVIMIIKSMGLAVAFNPEQCPPQFKELLDKGYLFQVN